MGRQCTHCRYARTGPEQRFEKPPAVRWNTDKIQRKLPECQPLDTGSTLGNQGLAKLSPASGTTDINQGLKTRAP
jgi:hypothetical protein